MSKKREKTAIIQKVTYDVNLFFFEQNKEYILSERKKRKRLHNVWTKMLHIDLNLGWLYITIFSFYI